MPLIQTICSNNSALQAGKEGARSVDVGALSAVFEKSDTELKLKPKPKPK